MWCVKVPSATQGGSQNGCFDVEWSNIPQQDLIGWEFPSVDGLPGNHPWLLIGRKPGSVCPLPLAVTVAALAGQI